MFCRLQSAKLHNYSLFTIHYSFIRHQGCLIQEVFPAVIYIDEVFAVNAAVNWLLLLTATAVTGGGAGRLRLGLGAVFGGLWAVAVWLPHLRWLGSLPGELLGFAGLCLICFGWRGPAWKSWLWFFGVSCAFAGLVLAVTALLRIPAFQRGSRVYYRVTGPLLILLAGGVWLICRLCLDRFARHRGRELVLLGLELNGRRVLCTALRDNGNTLREPVTGEAVPVAQWQLAARLLPELELTAEAFADPPALLGRLRALDPPLSALLVPYRAVGVAGGLLLALRLDRITENGRPLRTRLAAFSPTQVSDGGCYEALVQS